MPGILKCSGSAEPPLRNSRPQAGNLRRKSAAGQKAGWAVLLFFFKLHNIDFNRPCPKEAPAFAGASFLDAWDFEMLGAALPARRAVFSFDYLHLLGIPAARGGLHPSGLKTPQNPAFCGVFYYFSRLSRSIRLIYCWVNCSSPDMAGETAWLFFHASTVPDSRGGERGINFRPSYVQFSLILR